MDLHIWLLWQRMNHLVMYCSILLCHGLEGKWRSKYIWSMVGIIHLSWTLYCLWCDEYTDVHADSTPLLYTEGSHCPFSEVWTTHMLILQLTFLLCCTAHIANQQSSWIIHFANKIMMLLFLDIFDCHPVDLLCSSHHHFNVKSWTAPMHRHPQGCTADSISFYQ